MARPVSDRNSPRSLVTCFFPQLMATQVLSWTSIPFLSVIWFYFSATHHHGESNLHVLAGLPSEVVSWFESSGWPSWLFLVLWVLVCACPMGCSLAIHCRWCPLFVAGIVACDRRYWHGWLIYQDNDRDRTDRWCCSYISIILLEPLANSS